MKKCIITAVALCVCAGLSAQNLNPVVEVTNTYAREASGIDKPAQLLAVPDSVYSFNLDMDYSVRNTPYQGSYEFKPYRVQLRPQPRQSEEGRLFVRLGHVRLSAGGPAVSREKFRILRKFIIQLKDFCIEIHNSYLTFKYSLPQAEYSTFGFFHPATNAGFSFH